MQKLVKKRRELTSQIQHLEELKLREDDEKMKEEKEDEYYNAEAEKIYNDKLIIRMKEKQVQEK